MNARVRWTYLYMLRRNSHSSILTELNVYCISKYKTQHFERNRNVVVISNTKPAYIMYDKP